MSSGFVNTVIRPQVVLFDGKQEHFANNIWPAAFSLGLWVKCFENVTSEWINVRSSRNKRTSVSQNNDFLRVPWWSCDLKAAKHKPQCPQLESCWEPLLHVVLFLSFYCQLTIKGIICPHKLTT